MPFGDGLGFRPVNIAALAKECASFRLSHVGHKSPLRVNFGHSAHQNRRLIDRQL